MTISLIKRLPTGHKWSQWLKYRDEKPIFQNNYNRAKPTVLFSCASLGEYEAIKMIALGLKPSHNVQLMFFSPSGYKPMLMRKEEWNALSYSPLDSNKAIETTLSILQPDIIVISGNEIWPNFIKQLIKRNIPYLFMGSTFQKSGWVETLYYELMYPYLAQSKIVYSHSKETVEHFTKNSIKALHTPNMRMASIWYDNYAAAPILPKMFFEFCRYKPTIIFGSIYELELQILRTYQDILLNKYQVIIVLHDNDSNKIKALKEKFYRAILWSDIDQLEDHNTLIVNKLGILKHLYQHCSVSYIGGGFHKGIHNVFESVIHSVPTIIGPKYQKFPEVVELVKSGNIKSINKIEELIPAVTAALADHESESSFQLNIAQTQESVKQIVKYITSLSST